MALLVLLVSAAAPFASSANTADSLILSYEAPTAGLRANGEWARGPYASVADPAGVTGDGRVDAGRLLVDFQEGATTVDVTVADAVMPFTPLRLEWFKASGAGAGAAASVCAAQFKTSTVTVPPAASVLVVWVNGAGAAGDLGECPLGSTAGATRGDVLLEFARP